MGAGKNLAGWRASLLLQKPSLTKMGTMVSWLARILSSRFFPFSRLSFFMALLSILVRTSMGVDKKKLSGRLLRWGKWSLRDQFFFL